MFSLNFTTLFFFIYLGLNKPYILPTVNHTEMFNEFCLLCINYHFLCFTQMVPGAPEQYAMGTSMIVLTCIIILVSFS